MICPFNIYPNGQFSVDMSKDPGEKPFEIVLRHMWKDVEKYRIARQKQRSVKSICTITLLAQVVCTLPGWLSVPANSINLSLLQCAKPTHRDRRQEHSQRSYAKREKKKLRNGKNETNYAKRKIESYLLSHFLTVRFHMRMLKYRVFKKDREGMIL